MELVEKLMKLNVLYVHEMQREGNIKLTNMGQLTEPLGVHSPNITLIRSCILLKEKINKYSKIDYLKEEINNLYEEISNSKEKDLKYWNGNKTEREKELEDLAFKRLFFMETCSVGLKDASEILGIPVTTLKHACQQNRLLNTIKVGSNWMVHLPECRAYWNIEDTNEKSLYRDLQY